MLAGALAETLLQLLSGGGQAPFVRRALALSAAGVLEQTVTLQTREELGDLALVLDAGGVRDLTVGWVGSGLAKVRDERYRANFTTRRPGNTGFQETRAGTKTDFVPDAAYGRRPAIDPDRALTIGKRGAIMKLMAKAQTNGKIEKLSPEELAEFFVPAVYKTPEEKRAALKRATTGLRFKTRITRDMYRPG